MTTRAKQPEIEIERAREINRILQARAEEGDRRAGEILKMLGGKPPEEKRSILQRLAWSGEVFE